MIGENIRSYRKAAGLTQNALANRLNTGQSTVAQWEGGERTPPIKRLLDIARVLGVAPADLLETKKETEGDAK